MDKKWLINNIQEAQVELADIIEKLNTSSSLEFEMSMHHVFYHLNLAYNTNKMSENEIKKLTPDDINALVRKNINYYSLS